MTEKRGLIPILVIATVVIFVGLVWAISTYLPLNLAAAPSPTFTANAPRVAANCTSPIGYWRQHPGLYPAQVVIGGQVYQAGDLGKLFSSQTEDLPAKLQAQLTASYLNILSGADQSYIETTIFEAYGWLVQHPAGSEVSGAVQEEGTRLFNLLEAYNLGMTGVEACEAAAAYRLTELITIADTPTITVTPSPTGTPTASETPTSTEITATVTNASILPTRAATRTNVPPSQNPTSPPVEPTQAPAPTNTPAPTAAPTNTPVPPAPTYTLPPLPIPTNTLPPP